MRGDDEVGDGVEGDGHRHGHVLEQAAVRVQQRRGHVLQKGRARNMDSELGVP